MKRITFYGLTEGTAMDVAKNAVDMQRRIMMINRNSLPMNCMDLVPRMLSEIAPCRLIGIPISSVTAFT